VPDLYSAHSALKYLSLLAASVTKLPSLSFVWLTSTPIGKNGTDSDTGRKKINSIKNTDEEARFNDEHSP